MLRPLLMAMPWNCELRDSSRTDQGADDEGSVLESRDSKPFLHVFCTVFFMWPRLEAFCSVALEKLSSSKFLRWSTAKLQTMPHSGCFYDCDSLSQGYSFVVAILSCSGEKGVPVGGCI